MFAIDHDLHIHSTLSRCCQSDTMIPDVIADRALAHGRKTICVTNHIWDKAAEGAAEWYAPGDLADDALQDFPSRMAALPLPQKDGLRFLFGCEADFSGGKRLSLAQEHFDCFDLILVAVNHMHLKGLIRPLDVDNAEKMAELFTRRMEELLLLPLPWHKVGIAHMNIHHMFKEGTAAQVLRLLDRKRWDAIFAELARRGTGVELNAAAFITAGEELDVHLDFFRRAKAQGCRFYCGSDAHKLESLDIAVLENVVAQLGLTDEDRFSMLME